MGWQVLDALGRRKQVTTPPIPTAMVQLYDGLLSSASAGFDIQNLSQAYVHLKVLAQLRGSAAAAAVDSCVRFNNDSGANYDRQYLSAASGSVGSGQVEAETQAYTGAVAGNSAPANEAGTLELIIFNYAATTFYARGHAKATRRQAAGVQGLYESGFGWRNTAAINRLLLYPDTGNWMAGSRLSIYGII